MSFVAVQLSETGISGGGGNWLMDCKINGFGMPAVLKTGFVLSLKKMGKAKTAVFPALSATAQKISRVWMPSNSSKIEKPDIVESKNEAVMLFPMAEDTVGAKFPKRETLQFAPSGTVSGWERLKLDCWAMAANGRKSQMEMTGSPRQKECNRFNIELNRVSVCEKRGDWCKCFGCKMLIVCKLWQKTTGD